MTTSIVELKEKEKAKKIVIQRAGKVIKSFNETYKIMINEAERVKISILEVQRKRNEKASKT